MLSVSSSAWEHKDLLAVEGSHGSREFLRSIDTEARSTTLLDSILMLQASAMSYCVKGGGFLARLDELADRDYIGIFFDPIAGGRYLAFQYIAGKSCRLLSISRFE